MSGKKSKRLAAEELIDSMIEELTAVSKGPVTGIADASKQNGTQAHTQHALTSALAPPSSSENSRPDFFLQLEQAVSEQAEATQFGKLEGILPDSPSGSPANGAIPEPSVVRPSPPQLISQTASPDSPTTVSAGLSDKVSAPQEVVSASENNQSAEIEPTVVVGTPRKSKPNQEANPRPTANPLPSFELNPSSATQGQLVQAEALRAVQARLSELEQDNERLREENELLGSAGELSRSKLEEVLARIEGIQKQRDQQLESKQNEINLYREALNEKERDLAGYRSKIQELEARLKNEFKSIRNRERELENRLELGKLEKNALMKSKDEALLDYKRRLDQSQIQVESQKLKIHELSRKVEENNEQLSRTVRALRLAITTLEVSDTDGMTIVPIRKTP